MDIDGDIGDHGGMRCSSDLRQRVVEFVRSGGSKAEAARRFRVGEASVDRWLKPGGLAYKRPGPQRPHKLDWEAVRRHGFDFTDYTPEKFADLHATRYRPWAERVEGAGIKVSMVLDIVAFGVSLHDVEIRHRMSKKTAVKRLIAALDMY